MEEKPTAVGNEALRSQLEALEAQKEQLAALIGDDPQGLMLQLQTELTATIDGIRERLQQYQEKSSTTTTAAELDDGRLRVGVGDVCLAPRVFDRRRVRAVVEAVDEAKGTCLVTWVHPRQKRELVCRYWKEGRNCKFSGPDCPFSHGVETSLSELFPDNSNDAAEEDVWLASITAGSRLLARYHDRVWYEAIAEERLPATPSTGGDRDRDGRGFLAVRFRGFEEDGPVVVEADASHLAPLETLGGVSASSGGMEGRSTARGDDQRGGGGSGSRGEALGSEEEEESDFEDAWADAPHVYQAGNPDAYSNGGGDGFFQERVLGDRRLDGGGGGEGSGLTRGGAGAEGGLCSDAYVFGDWEQHTKGFGSRMMSRMGYRRGEGLGREKQGIARPVPIHVLPERRALDHLRGDDGRHPPRSTNSGNTRKNKQKPGSASRSQDDDGEPQKAMFDFLNVTIHASAKGGRRGALAAAAPASTTNKGRSPSSLAARRPVFDRSSPLTARGSSGGHGGGGGVSKGSSTRGGATKSSAKRAVDMTKSELRSHVVGAREAEVALAAKASRLKETIDRNVERDPRTAAQAKQKLEEVKAQAAEVSASRDRAERVLGDKGDRSRSGGKGGLFSF